MKILQEKTDLLNNKLYIILFVSKSKLMRFSKKDHPHVKCTLMHCGINFDYQSVLPPVSLAAINTGETSY